MKLVNDWLFEWNEKKINFSYLYSYWIEISEISICIFKCFMFYYL